MENSIEMQLHAKCAQWFWNEFHDYRQMLIHVDNNSYNAIEGSRKKAMGVVKGVSDFILIGNEGRVAFIELKTKTGKLKPEQELFYKKLRDRHHLFFVVRSLDEFQNLIYELL